MKVAIELPGLHDMIDESHVHADGRRVFLKGDLAELVGRVARSVLHTVQKAELVGDRYDGGADAVNRHLAELAATIEYVCIPPPDRGHFRRSVSLELARARGLFPDGEFNLAALVEEVGEFAEAVGVFERGANTMAADDRNAAIDRVRDEGVQVCAMCLRVAQEGDRSLGYDPSPESGQ